MKINIRLSTLVIIALLLLSLVEGVIIFWPKKPGAVISDTLQEKLASKQAEIDSLTAHIQAIAEKKRTDSLEFLSRDKSRNEQINGLLIKVVQLKGKPGVIEAVDLNPDLGGLLDTQDEVMAAQVDRIAEQGAHIIGLEQGNRDMKATFERKIGAMEDSFALEREDMAGRMDAVSEENRKLRRRLVITKVVSGAVVLAVVLVSL